jgi:Flp pilus assembly pilin Flp
MLRCLFAKEQGHSHVEYVLVLVLITVVALCILALIDGNIHQRLR